jgi:hypothetical protein
MRFYYREIPVLGDTERYPYWKIANVYSPDLLPLIERVACTKTVTIAS